MTPAVLPSLTAEPDDLLTVDALVISSSIDWTWQHGHPRTYLEPLRVSRDHPRLRPPMSMDPRSPHRSRICKALDYASPVLDLSSAASDALPPLKGVVGGALWIVNAVRVCHVLSFRSPLRSDLITAPLMFKGFEADQEEWHALASYIRQLVCDVIEVVPAEVQQCTLEEPLHQLDQCVANVSEPIPPAEAQLLSFRVLSHIRLEIEDMQAQPSRKRWLAFLKDRTKIAEYKLRVDRAVVIFSVSPFQLMQPSFNLTFAWLSCRRELRSSLIVPSQNFVISRPRLLKRHIKLPLSCAKMFSLRLRDGSDVRSSNVSPKLWSRIDVRGILR